MLGYHKWQTFVMTKCMVITSGNYLWWPSAWLSQVANICDDQMLGHHNQQTLWPRAWSSQVANICDDQVHGHHKWQTFVMTKCLVITSCKHLWWPSTWSSQVVNICDDQVWGHHKWQTFVMTKCMVITNVSTKLKCLHFLHAISAIWQKKYFRQKNIN